MFVITRKYETKRKPWTEVMKGINGLVLKHRQYWRN